MLLRFLNSRATTFTPTSTAIPFGTRLSILAGIVTLYVYRWDASFSPSALLNLMPEADMVHFQDSAVLPLHGMLLREFTT
jgi:hypothetical protein